MTNAEPEQPAGAQSETAHSETAPPPARRLFWLWLALVVIAAAVIGGTIGRSLGLRQGGPLSSQAAANGRPTIVVATPAAVVSVTSSPSAVVPTAVVSATPAVAGASEYVVQPGDTLRTIAQEQLGDAQLWPRIYQANRDLIGPDPDALLPGTRLQLPPG